MMKRLLWLCAAVIGAGCSSNVRQLRDPTTVPVNGKAERTRTDEALDYSVAIRIAAPPQAVWDVLVDAPSYPTWNSTIVKLDGEIAAGKELKLVSKVAPDRTFDLKVSTFDPAKRLVWEDGGRMFLGVRTFTLMPADAGTVLAMSETFSGAMLGMIEGSLPDFTASFDAFAADLKAAAERRAASAAAEK